MIADRRRVLRSSAAAGRYRRADIACPRYAPAPRPPSRICLWVTTRPACLARNDSSSNSFGVSLSSAPARVTRWRTASTSRLPTRSTGISALRCMRCRKRRAHPRQQFADVERLVDVVVGAEIERLDLFGLALARRQHDDRHVGPFARAPDHVLAVAVRQAEIEQHDVGRFRRRCA